MSYLNRIVWLIACPLISLGNPGILEFSDAVYSVVEPVYDGTEATEQAQVEVSIVRHGGSAGRVEVVYCTAAIDSLSFARDSLTKIDGSRVLFAVRDYPGSQRPSIGEASGIMVWEDGESGPKSFLVPVLSDRAGAYWEETHANPLVEGTENLSLFLSAPTGGARLGARWMARVDILDAEAPSGNQGVIQFSMPRYPVREDAGAVDVVVSRVSGSSGAVSAVFETLAVIEHHPYEKPCPLTPAIPETNYTPVLQTLTWSDGDATDKVVSVPIHDNGAMHFSNDSRGIKAISLSLHSPTGGALTSVNRALVLIIDDESRDFGVWVDNEYGKLMRVYLPDTTDPIRGLLYFMPGTGGDWRGKTGVVANRALADHYRFAVAGQLANSFAESEPYGVGQFYNLLFSLAQFTGRPELANAPVFFTGISAGAYNSNSSSFAVPEQTLGFVSHRAGTFPFASGTSMSTDERTVPGMMISGSTDSTTPSVEHHEALLRFRAQPEGGARITSAVDWNRGHTSEGGQGWAMMYLYLDELIRLRYPDDEVPGPLPGQRPNLRTIPLEHGWLAEQVSAFDTGGRADPMRASRNLHVAPFDSISTEERGDMGWLPGMRAALGYQAFSSLQSPIFPSARPFQSRLKISSHQSSSEFIPRAQVGEPLQIEVDPRSFELFDYIDFYYDTEWIGRRTEAPWSLSYTPTSPGVGLIRAVADGTYAYALAYAFDVVLVSGEPQPLGPPQLSLEPLSDRRYRISWEPRPYGYPDFAIEAAPAPEGPWAPVDVSIAPHTRNIDQVLSEDPKDVFLRTVAK